MSLYVISIQPLISRLSIFSQAKQCWYGDDATGAGLLEELRKWWNELNNMGPSLGHYPNANKCWLVYMKENKDFPLLLLLSLYPGPPNITHQ